MKPIIEASTSIMEQDWLIFTSIGKGMLEDPSVIIVQVLRIIAVFPTQVELQLTNGTKLTLGADHKVLLTENGTTAHGHIVVGRYRKIPIRALKNLATRDDRTVSFFFDSGYIFDADLHDIIFDGDDAEDFYVPKDNVCGVTITDLGRVLKAVDCPILIEMKFHPHFPQSIA